MTQPFDSRPRSGYGSLPSSGWEATRVQTQIATRFLPGGPDADLRDIGHPVDDRTRELFVAVDPAEALIQQFDHLRPEYIAVHDLGTTASRKLINGLASASQRPVQRLVFRRAGGGMTLATIEFVDCVANQRTVRIYSTAVEADTAARQAMARALLARSTVGVVIAGDLPLLYMGDEFAQPNVPGDEVARRLAAAGYRLQLSGLPGYDAAIPPVRTARAKRAKPKPTANSPAPTRHAMTNPNASSSISPNTPTNASASKSSTATVAKPTLGSASPASSPPWSA